MKQQNSLRSQTGLLSFRPVFRRASLRRGLLILVSLLVLGSLASTALGAPGEGEAGVASRIWATERVDAPQAFYNLTSRSLRLDSNDNPRLAFGGDHLYYARYDSNTWKFDTVDGGFGVGQYASLALDKNSNPHIAYYDSLNGALKFAYWTGSSWIVEVVDAPGMNALTAAGGPAEAAAPQEGESSPLSSPLAGLDLARQWQDPLLVAESGGSLAPLFDGTGSGVGMYASIAVDSSNRAHISYFDADNRDLKYAHETSDGWDIEVLDSSGKVGKYTAIALDSNKDAHISYFDETNDQLKYLHQVDGDWQKAQVVEESNGENVVGGYTSIALSSGSPRISYYVFDGSTGEGSLKYATQASGDWVTSVVDDSGDVGLYTSLALDSFGRPRISYYDATDGDLKYARWTGSAWRIDTVAWSGDVGRDTSIAVDSNDNAHISYIDVDNGLLNESYVKNSAWATRNVTVSRDVGLSSSLRLDASGLPHISYYNDTTDDLKYAARSGSTWQPGVVADAGSIGSYSSLGLTSAGLPGIAYYDASNQDLKYAYWSNGWAIQTVDSTGNVGQYPSIVIDNQNVVSVVYYNATKGDLIYATAPYSNGVWGVYDLDDLRTGDDKEDMGRYASLATYGNRFYAVACLDATNKRIEYAYWDGAKWIFGPIPGTEGDVRDISLTFDSAGAPHISFYDAANGDLKYATQSGGTWTVQTLDSAGNVGQYSSIKVSSAGTLFISYYDADNGDLRLYERTGGQAKISVVDSPGQVGLYTSLDVDASGYPHISYYDATNGDLKYTTGWVAAYQLFLPQVWRNK